MWVEGEGSGSKGGGSDLPPIGGREGDSYRLDVGQSRPLFAATVSIDPCELDVGGKGRGEKSAVVREGRSGADQTAAGSVA